MFFFAILVLCAVDLPWKDYNTFIGFPYTTFAFLLGCVTSMLVAMGAGRRVRGAGDLGHGGGVMAMAMAMMLAMSAYVNGAQPLGLT